MKINNFNYHGLSSQEVKQRIDLKQTNKINQSITKTYKEIFCQNILTFFNLINIILFLFVLFVLSYKNILFIFIIIINTAAGIYQEIKAKRILDQLSLLEKQTIEVIRDNKIELIDIENIVLDDDIILTTGKQIPVDCTMIDGHIEVNESLLTGEADAIFKQNGDTLLSGSYVTSGKAICHVIRVGDESYINKIIDEAKQYQQKSSQLYQSLDHILKIISIIIIPIGILLFLKQFLLSRISLQNAILSTVAALLGMIPEGLVLLTSVALTLSILRLAKKQTLVRDLYSIETLARVDTVCLDKTGTLTKGQLTVENIESFNNQPIREIIANMNYCFEDKNSTAVALQEYFKQEHNYHPVHIVPFSSKRKYSAVSFENKGTYYIGAYQFLFPNGHEYIEKKYNEYSHHGLRIIILAHHNKIIQDDQLLEQLEPIGMITLTDIVRQSAPTTLQYFKNQGTNIKIISGDDPVTVSNIARKAGLDGYQHYIDASSIENDCDIINLVEKYNIFGRVSPEQKKQIVLALQHHGHTVAMTGDGVNDILAFKVADCAIAMASGSEAAKNCANIVLLDNQFEAIPDIVNEGRRVINNITASSSMFLIKTTFSVILAIGTILFGSIYPFLPIQLSVLGACCVGIPTFFLTYEANFNRVQSRFMYHVFKNAFPYGILIAISSIIIMNIGQIIGFNSQTLSTICVLITGWCYYCGLKDIYSPMTLYRKVVIYVLQICYFIILIIGQKFLSLGNIDFFNAIVLIFIITTSHMFFDFNRYIYDLLFIHFKKKYQKKEHRVWTKK